MLLGPICLGVVEGCFRQGLSKDNTSAFSDASINGSSGADLANVNALFQEYDQNRDRGVEFFKIGIRQLLQRIDVDQNGKITPGETQIYLSSRQVQQSSSSTSSASTPSTMAGSSVPCSHW